jgi:NADPH-dependent 2,4-dienoyl-CoA reductase/sulfur reductase-like enzyme
MLRNLDDTQALKRAVTPDTKAVIVGAGFIGCEVAATLRGLGVEEVTLVDIAPHPMPVLGPEIGARAAQIHEQHGVRLRMPASVASFEGSERVEAVVLGDGERIDADFVLLALGSVPNSEWLEGSGLTLHKGTDVCDEHFMAVGVEGVAAAGDVASYPHPGADGPIWIEHWSNARDLVAAAALNLLRGGEGSDSRQPFVAVPTFWSDQYDVKIKSAGLLSIADRYTVIEEDPERPALVAEAYRGDELIGAVVFNRNRTIIGYQRQLAAALVA